MSLESLHVKAFMRHLRKHLYYNASTIEGPQEATGVGVNGSRIKFFCVKTSLCLKFKLQSQNPAER
jgi:hypothetical protein